MTGIRRGIFRAIIEGVKQLWLLQNRLNIEKASPFANTADESIVHTGEAKELKDRKPDRVYGLSRVFGPHCSPRKHAKLLHLLKVEHSPFGQNGSRSRVLFPFLICEAKKQQGNTFLACQHQTAFPIWKLLKLQEDLEKASHANLDELGGPLVWFLANRGEVWKLYGCYITNDQIGQIYVCLNHFKLRWISRRILTIKIEHPWAMDRLTIHTWGFATTPPDYWLYLWLGPRSFSP